MWLTDGLLVTSFGRWKGQCTYTLIPVWLMCGSRTQLLTCRIVGAHSELCKTCKVWKTSNFYKGSREALVGILDLISSSHLELLKMAAT